jgi:regulator of protease activity HflC (stomatin/prohibitin superfamily)
LPIYNVWESGKSGEATLAEARYGRQARVEEARSRFDAAELEAKAAIVRAEGQAKANEVIAKTLNPSVLQYQWLEMLTEQGGVGDRTVIYIPVNPATGLPVSIPTPEAGRLPLVK